MTEQRRRAFAAAYIKLEGNGVEAARAAGYRGHNRSLRTIAGRLLRLASVRAILEQHAQAAEARTGMGVEEIIARIATQASADVGGFVRLITPEDARLAVTACGDDKDRAKRILAAIEGTGFAVDVEQGIRAGKSAHLKSISVEMTPEGAPRVRIEVRDPLPALALLAKIRGLTNDQPPPPPPQNITLNMILGEMPLEVLRVLRDQLDTAAQRRRAIPAVIVP